MAIIIEGATKCKICGLPIERGDRTKGFPAFLTDDHPLYRYSDSAMHMECYETCPDKAALEDVYGRWDKIWASRPVHLKSEKEMKEWHEKAFKDFK
jgi:hypothetical protein